MRTSDTSARIVQAGSATRSLRTPAKGDDVSMWMRIFGWMLADDEPPMPCSGALLRSVGVRVRGAVTVADRATRGGVVVVSGGDSADPHQILYACTGIAGRANDVWTDTGRRGERHRHAGAEFVLTVGAHRFQVEFDGPASEVRPDSRVTVTGRLELVGAYEWDAFNLVDTRADWMVMNVVRVPDGDVLVDLALPRAA